MSVPGNARGNDRQRRPVRLRRPPIPAHQGNLAKARQGSATPIATPQHHARAGNRTPAKPPANPAAVHASRSPLTRPQRPSWQPTSSAHERSWTTGVALARRGTYDACNTTSEPASEFNARVACSGSSSHWKTLSAPVTKQSGRVRTVTRRLAVHDRLRDALCYWASGAVQKDPASKARYQALRARGHGHHRALRNARTSCPGGTRVEHSNLPNRQSLETPEATAY